MVSEIYFVNFENEDKTYAHDNPYTARFQFLERMINNGKGALKFIKELINSDLGKDFYLKDIGSITVDLIDEETIDFIERGDH